MATSGFPVDRPASEREVKDLLTRLRPQFRSIFFRFRVSPVDAEDLLQQALLGFVTQRRKIHNPESWLIGTLKNQCRMHWRNRSRRLYDAVDETLLEGIAQSTHRPHEEVDLRHDLELALGQIPSRCRSMLRARYYRGCGAEEVARLGGYRKSGVYKVLDRCLAALTRQLTTLGFSAEASDA